jgi:hypothetical protein
MKWKFFVGATILAGGLLIKFGVPLIPIVLGVALAALWNWSRFRRA